jgi:O-antigen/teichoic acid export membrane protein
MSAHSAGLSRWSEHAQNMLTPLFCRVTALLVYAAGVSVFINRRGEADYALVGMLLMLLAFSPLLDFGVGYAFTIRLVRALVRGGHDTWSLVMDAWALFLALAIALASIGYLGSTSIGSVIFRDSPHATEIFLAFLTAAVLLLDALPSAVLQAQNRLSALALSRFLSDASRSIVVLTGGLWDWPTTTIFTFFIAIAIGKLALTCSLAFSKITNIRFVWPRKQSIKILLWIGAPMGSCVLLSTVFNLFDKVIATRFLTPEVAAQYIVSVDLNIRAYFLIWAVHGALYTPFIRQATMGLKSGSLLRTAMAAVAIVTACYYVPLFVFAEPVLALWINPTFATEASPIVRVFAITSVIYMLVDAHTILLRAHRRTTPQIVGLSLGLAFAASGGLMAGFRENPLALALSVLIGHLVILAVFAAHAFRSGLYK